MSAAALDRLLAILVVALATSGLISLRLGAPGDGWLFTLHGLLGAALAVTATIKVWRSLPRAVRARRWGRLAIAMLVTVATAAALVGGFAWVASGRLLSIGSWTVLTIHAWIGLVLVPVVAIHLLPRRWRLLVPRFQSPTSARSTPRPGRAVSPEPVSRTRRRVLVGATFAAASVGLFGAAQLADRVRGGERRFTGSRWLPTGGIPPVTTFLGEGTPVIDRDTWRLRVHGKVTRELELSAVELAAFDPTETAAVLDCTSGWALETGWSGVALSAVLTSAGVSGDTHGEVIVRSVTGWGSRLSATDVGSALLATSVAGHPLPAGNGAPCRLVLPDHRGLDWVKWVTDIEVT